VKKLVTIFIALIYLGTTTGATFYKHYCMGEVAGWGMGYEQSAECDNCGMANSNQSENGCCKDEQKFIKNDSDQRSAVNNIDFKSINPLACLFPISGMHECKITAAQRPASLYHSPPVIITEGKFLLYCVFRI
jgi:hypothetical protein